VTVVSPDRAAARWQKAHGARLLDGAPRRGFRTVLKAIRVHQWLKNVLIFVPLVLNQEYASIGTALAAVVAFFAFSFAASAVYVLNDLTDLKNDRKHKTKRNRPLASGALSIPHGVMIGCGLALASLGLALTLPWEFVGVLVVYAVVTTTYSFVLKRKLLVDVFTLASLYTLRIVAGAMATGTDFSFWLLALFDLLLPLAGPCEALCRARRAGEGGRRKHRQQGCRSRLLHHRFRDGRPGGYRLGVLGGTRSGALRAFRGSVADVCDALAALAAVPAHPLHAAAHLDARAARPDA
jgi:hypothetical protein